MGRLTRGLIAGAAATAAINASTYADMAIRGRPASTTPQRSADRLAKDLHISLGAGDKADNRKVGLGALLGYATGIGTATAYALAGGARLPRWASALALGTAAMAASNVPMAKMGISDPRTWSVSDWLADAIPHLIYGVTAAAVLDHERR